MKNMIKKDHLKKVLAGASLIPLMLIPMEAAFGAYNILPAGLINSDVAAAGAVPAGPGDGFQMNGTQLNINQAGSSFTEFNSHGTNGNAVTATGGAIAVRDTFVMGSFYDEASIVAGVAVVPAANRIALNLANTAAVGNVITLNSGYLPGQPLDAAITALAANPAQQIAFANAHLYSALGAVNLAGRNASLVIAAPVGVGNNPRFDLLTTFANVGKAHLDIINSAVFEHASVLEFGDININDGQVFKYDNTNAAANVAANIHDVATPAGELTFGGANATAWIKNSNTGNMNLDLTFVSDVDPGGVDTANIFFENTTTGALNIHGAGKTLGLVPGGNTLKEVRIMPTAGPVAVEPQINADALTFGDTTLPYNQVSAGLISLTGGSNTTTTSFLSNMNQPVIPVAGVHAWGTLDYKHFHGDLVLGTNLTVGDVANGAFDNTFTNPRGALNQFNIIDLAGNDLISNKPTADGKINVGIVDTGGVGLFQIMTNTTFTSTAGINANLDFAALAGNTILDVAATKPDGTAATATDVTLIGNVGGAVRTITFPAVPGQVGTIRATTPLQIRNAAVTNPLQAAIDIPDNSSVEIFSNAVAGVSTISAVGPTKSKLILNTADEDLHFLPQITAAPVTNQTLNWNANTEFQFTNGGAVGRTVTLDNSFLGNTGQAAPPPAPTVNKGKFFISTSAGGDLIIDGAVGEVLGGGGVGEATETITLAPVNGIIDIDLPTNTLTLNIGQAGGAALVSGINISEPNVSSQVKFFQKANVAVGANSTWGQTGPVDFNGTSSTVSLVVGADLTILNDIINGPTSIITLNDGNLIAGVDGKTWNCTFAQGLAGGGGLGAGVAQINGNTVVSHQSLGLVNVEIAAAKKLTMNVVNAGGVPVLTNFTRDLNFAGGGATLSAVTPVTVSGTITNAANGLIEALADVTMTSADSQDVGTYLMGPDVTGRTPQLNLAAAGDYTSVIDFSNVTPGKYANVNLNVLGINLTQNAISPAKGQLNANQDATLTDVSIGTWGGGINIGAGKSVTVDATGAAGPVVVSQVADHTFGDGASRLILSNITSANPAIIDLQRSIVGGKIDIFTDYAPAGATGLTLTSTAGNATLGSSANPSPEINILGNGSIDVRTPIFSDNTNIGDGTDNPTTVRLGKVQGNDINILSDVTGNVILADDIVVDHFNYNNKAVNTLIENGKHLNATHITAGDIAALEFAGDGRLTGTIDKMGALYAGVGNVTMLTDGVTHVIDNIYGTGPNTLTLAKDVTIDGNIDNDSTHQGPNGKTNGPLNVTLTGDTTIKGSIGATNAIGDITFAIGGGRNLAVQGAAGIKANRIILNGDNLGVAGDVTTAAGLILTNGANFGIGKSVTVTGPASFDHSNIVVQGNTLTFNGATTFKGLNNMQTNVAADGLSAGHLAVGPTGKLTAAGSILTVNVNTQGLATSVDGKTFTIIDNTAGGTYTPGTVLIAEKKNPNVRWVYDTTTGEMKGINYTRPNADSIIPKTDAGKELSGDALAEYIEEVIGALPQDVLDKLATDPDAEVALLNELSEQPNDFGANAAPVLNTILSNVVFNISNAFVSTVTGRVDTFNAPLPSLVNPCAVSTGVASGDCVEKELPLGGVWINPFYGYGKQKPIKKKSAGYNINTAGATIGVDGFLDENNVVGAAIGYADNKLKFSGQQKHDNTRAKTKLASAYWRGDLPGDNFMQVIGNVANHRLSTKERRGSDILGYSVATGSPKARSYGLEAQAGHNFNSEAGRFTPVVGIRQSNFKMNGYTEKNGHLYNLKHDSLKFNRTEGMAGLKWAMPNDLMGFTPEVHASVYHSFKNTKLHPTIRVMGAGGAIGSQDFPTIKHTLPKTSYNIGAGVNTAINEFMDLGANYDLNIGKKYLGHQGSFKIRAMF